MKVHEHAGYSHAPIGRCGRSCSRSFSLKRCIYVCPVDAFREGPNFLAIDPEERIDCAVCVPECSVEAIFADEDVPAGQLDFIALNAELARDWRPITRTKDALPDADHWAVIQDKRAELLRT